ncbi:bifunctional UDP-N-acetylglucosamine pyrophosphorylase/glucosamine-1-phosphate N-acetyltransferase [Weissella uvarum]|uniref:bifunctional UDP-N-acetylglucosamine diphosphorylase/glucosamine-1-phosphate N-acetyltransferase GlmU n=1 Tax=Weissella uvarum TaxID=1479233 RepID=UPI001961EFA2|nr:bifunctional UDP-N-acetylglucosamine diphosphorylase/glucosamine-1-phosphate N-acetyltransferase GlmU [Weissella uvarum]MBM7617642.1 bifunctional UDP-N-acetylglucosamine pyrophosphorylase/glucosamine-1-phosphate N-acetyltransferase [Weissella uvarum]MCM0595991.1 bifunctional UDP-N-acetylglucosamine diphosphorylase/glucosamine-1-phosphate N-acetyltransferase GlmU [Weissella uvarum]
MDRYIIILAAGKGTRMKSDMPKVLHQVGGKAMVELVLDASEALHPQKIVTVVGHGAEQVSTVIGDRSAVVEQKEQLGTGHAILMAEDELGDKDGMTLIASGDAPLFTVDTLNHLFEYHATSGNAVTVLTAKAPDPTGYGRIVRDELGNVVRIVEQKDATPAEQAIHEVNTGVYVFDNKLLFSSLHEVTNDNAQGEYYLPDTLEILRTQGYTVGAYTMEDFDESMGVNDRVALSKANAVLRERVNKQHMQNGVTLIDPQTTYIDTDVQIGRDTVIEPNVVLKGHTVIGANVHLTSGTQIVDSVVDDGAQIDASHLEEAHVGPKATVGPFAHLRPKADLREEAHAGNFVEVKNATLGARSKMGHLSYLGDATVGEDVNIGAGTIFVNYDGVDKHHSNVGDRSFIGSNTKIISPVNIGDEAVTAAGSTITDDIPAHAMGIARSRQTTKPDFWKRTPLFKKFGQSDDAK